MVRREQVVSSSLCLFIVLALNACGPKNKTSLVDVKTDGVLVQASKSEIESAFPDQEITTVSSQANIYKLNASLEDVQNKLPHAISEENAVINVIPPFAKADGNDMAQSNALQNIYKQLNCSLIAEPPSAQISHLGGGEFIIMNNVRAGSSPITLTAEGSVSKPISTQGWFDFLLPSPAPKDRMEYYWVVQTPPGSMNPNQIQGPSYTLTPDQNGSYSISLIVKNSRTYGCDISTTTIGVTTDIPYAGRQYEWSPTKDPRFYHLPMVRAEGAWTHTEGQDTVVAVIDSGINYNHPDLANKLYINTREIPNNGVDDDRNGLVDDVYGYDFAFGDNIPYDDSYHGTHVAGLIAGTQSGVAPRTKILPIKSLFPTGKGTNASMIAAIQYAILMKVDVINMSFTGEGEASALLKNALQAANDAGILIVSAAGNSGKNIDEIPFNVTENDSSGVISVAATDALAQLADYSNYGVGHVSIAAPGGSANLPILSTYSYMNPQPYVGITGTSMAAPIVAGVAALIKSINKNLTHMQVKYILKESAVRVPNLSNKVQNGRFVNAEAAVQMAGQVRGSQFANY